MIIKKNALFQVENEIKKANYKLDTGIILLNTKFHDLILECSRNLRIKNQLDNLKSLVYFYRMISLNEKIDMRKYMNNI